MKGRIILSLLFIIALSGCNLRQREIELDRKLAEVNEREQRLSLKEQSLELREQQLNEKEKKLDSTTKRNGNDSLLLLHPQLSGIWNVKMQCTETNCSGSAVGDTKNEQWQFKFQDNGVIVSAKSNNELVRVYTGVYRNNVLQLSVHADTSLPKSARILVRLQQIQDKEMSGEREIIQPDGCRILYSLQLKKQ
jgi:hypothetical protein